MEILCRLAAKWRICEGRIFLLVFEGSEIFDRPGAANAALGWWRSIPMTSTRCQEAIGQIVADADERPLLVLRGTSQAIPPALPRFSGLCWAEWMFFFPGQPGEASAAIPVISPYLAVCVSSILHTNHRLFLTLITILLVPLCPLSEFTYVSYIIREYGSNELTICPLLTRVIVWLVLTSAGRVCKSAQIPAGYQGGSLNL